MGDFHSLRRCRQVIAQALLWGTRAVANARLTLVLIIAMLMLPSATFAQACNPPANAIFVVFDAGDFQLRKEADPKSAAIGEITGRNLLVLREVRRRGDAHLLAVSFNSETAWITVPSDRLPDVRFLTSEEQMSRAADSEGFEEGDNPSWGEKYPVNAMDGVLSCVKDVRLRRAQFFFSQAFDLMQKKDYDGAIRTFRLGFHYQSNDAQAHYYYAEAHKLRGTRLEALLYLYKRARDHRLPSDLDRAAARQIGELEQKVK